jgi:hypothetical protein
MSFIIEAVQCSYSHRATARDYSAQTLTTALQSGRSEKRATASQHLMAYTASESELPGTNYNETYCNARYFRSDAGVAITTWRILSAAHPQDVMVQITTQGADTQTLYSCAASINSCRCNPLHYSYKI